MKTSIGELFTLLGLLFDCKDWRLMRLCEEGGPCGVLFCECMEELNKFSELKRLKLLPVACGGGGGVGSAIGSSMTC